MSVKTSSPLLLVFLFIPIAIVGLVQSKYGPQLLDDGYYYLQIAYNLADGKGFTFDGIHTTNGFHPLWQIMITPVFFLTKNKLFAAFIVTTIQTLLFTGTGFVLVRLLKTVLKSNNYYYALVLWGGNLFFINKGAWSGMETGLLVLFYLLSLLALFRGLEQKAPMWIAGIFLCLTVAARLDAILFVAACGIVLCAKRKAHIRDCIRLFGPTIVFITVYAGINFFTYGHIMPISGYVKSFERTTALDNLLQDGNPLYLKIVTGDLLSTITLGSKLPLIVSMVFFTGLVGTMWLLIRRVEDNVRILLFIITLLWLMLPSYYLLFVANPLSIYSYYWMPIFVTALFSGIIFIETLCSQLWRRLIVCGMIVSTVLFSTFYYFSLRGTFSKNNFPCSIDFINTKLPPSAILGSWSAGYVGYYSQRKVVNLDNLVNNYELFECTKQQKLDKYLNDNNISYLANADFMNGPREWIENKLPAKLIYLDSMKVARVTTFLTVSPNQLEYERKLTAYQYFYIYQLERPAK